MKTRVRKRSVFDALRGHLLSIIFFAAIFAFFFVGVAEAQASNEAESRHVLEESINKAVVSCYAIEGRYPENVDYLKENYGLIYDEEKYAIGYIAFADNIMPDITIIELEGEVQG